MQVKEQKKAKNCTSGKYTLCNAVPKCKTMDVLYNYMVQYR